MSQHPHYLSVDESAALLGVNPKTVRRMISDGKLPAFRVGARLLRIREEHVYALLKPVPTVRRSVA